MKRSRLFGAAVGFVGGVAIGLGATFYLYGSNAQEPVGWLARTIAALVVGMIGALLGSLTGLSKE